MNNALKNPVFASSKMNYIESACFVDGEIQNLIAIQRPTLSSIIIMSSKCSSQFIRGVTPLTSHSLTFIGVFNPFSPKLSATSPCGCMLLQQTKSVFNRFVKTQTQLV